MTSGPEQCRWYADQTCAGQFGSCHLQLQSLSISWTTVTEPALAASPAADQFQTRQTLLSGDLFSTARLPCWSDQPIVSLVRCGCPQRSFCQFRRTTWTLLLVVSLLLLQDSGTRFLWTVELLHLLTHWRPGLRHFSLLRHNPHVARTSVPWRVINVLIDWLACYKLYFMSIHCYAVMVNLQLLVWIMQK